MGMSRLVRSAAGASMYWYSGPLTAGSRPCPGVEFIELRGAIRYLRLYEKLYHGLPAEALRGVTFAAFWSTGTIYAHRISPPEMSATMVRAFIHLLICLCIWIFNRVETHVFPSF